MTDAGCPAADNGAAVAGGPSSGNGVAGAPEQAADQAARLFELRSAPVRDFAGQAAAVASACHAMAARFHQGGKLVVFGIGGSSTDAQHVAVEFVHPVIVGKRALPAISLTTDVATVTGVAAREGLAGVFAHQIRHLAEPADMALGISANGNCGSSPSGLWPPRWRDDGPHADRRRRQHLPGR